MIPQATYEMAKNASANAASNQILLYNRCKKGISSPVVSPMVLTLCLYGTVIKIHPKAFVFP